MPYKTRGKCVYKKDTGKKVGCTQGSLKKYLAALHINAKEAKTPTITQKDTLAQIRKPMPPPQKAFKNKDAYNRKKFKTFKDFYTESLGTLNGQKVTDDTTATAEGDYAQGQDYVQSPSTTNSIGFSNKGLTFTVDEAAKKDQVLDAAIDFFEKLSEIGIPTDADEIEKFIEELHKIADKLSSVGIEPVDIIATIKTPQRAEQYLIKGPSAPGGGGRGALQDLKDIKAGLLTDDESNPGGPADNADYSAVDLNENFMDGKGPGRKGDSKRHGIKKKPSLASLDKIVHSKTASPRKKQLAHWQANMRRGKAKKKH